MNSIWKKKYDMYIQRISEEGLYYHIFASNDELGRNRRRSGFTGRMGEFRRRMGGFRRTRKGINKKN